MPNVLNANVLASAFGQQYVQDLSENFDQGWPFSPSVPAAKTGNLTTRTDNDTGVLTMDAGHGITTGARLDVYWTNADGTFGHRLGMTVGTVSVNTVPIDLGTGDNLPALVSGAYAVTTQVPDKESGVAIVGDNLVGILVKGSSLFPSVTVFRSAANATLLAVFLEPGENFIWSLASGVTNPLAGVTVDHALLSHSGLAASDVTGVLCYN